MFKILNFDKVQSTNKLAFDLIKDNKAQHQNIIIANEQSSGIGRMNRDWVSQRGNLFLSIILQFNDNVRISDYSFLSAICIGKTLEEFDIKTKFKWPNDIIYQDKKLCGILLQNETINNLNNLVIGIGLNLKSAPSYAISLEKHDIAREDFLNKLIKNFENYHLKYQQFGFSTIKNLWLKNAFKLNEIITLSNKQTGLFKGIDDEGNLILEDSNHDINKIFAEEIVN